ncbi:unnamed protein product, partial [Ilex paraguariensis]
MKKNRCKLCLKGIAKGRALGGHMRSHMLNLYVPPKPEQEQPSKQLGEETESTKKTESEREGELAMKRTGSGVLALTMALTASSI